MKRLTVLLALTVFSLTNVGVANAAQDGGIGTSSTGNAVINVKIPKLIRITGFQDFSFDYTTWDGTSDIAVDDNVCVWTNRKAGAEYKITATSSEGSFEVKDGGNSLAYQAFFNDQSGTSNNVQLGYSSPTATQSGASQTSTTCQNQGSPTANLQIKILASEAEKAKEGSYSGTIILKAEPE